MIENQLTSPEVLLKLEKEVKYFLGNTCLGNTRETAKWIVENCSDKDKLPIERYMSALEKFSIPNRK